MARLGKSDFVKGECMSELTLTKTLKKYTKDEVEEILMRAISDLNNMQVIKDAEIKIKVFQNPDENGVLVKTIKNNVHQTREFVLE